MQTDPADAWVAGTARPDRGHTIVVGMPFKMKLLLVQWLQREYKLTHDEAMQDADKLEKFLELNQ